MAHEMPLQPRPIYGPVATEVTLEWMLVWVMILEVVLAFHSHMVNYGVAKCK